METLLQAFERHHEALDIARTAPCHLPDEGAHLAASSLMTLIQSPRDTFGKRRVMPQAKPENPSTDIFGLRKRMGSDQILHRNALKLPKLFLTLLGNRSHSAILFC